MRIRKGKMVPLPAYFETSDGTPLTTGELSVANCLFDINYTDGTAPSTGLVATRFLGDGWYAYNFTDVLNKDFIYIARDSTSTYRNFPGGLVQISDVETVSATHTHVASDTSAQEVFSETITTPTEIRSIFLDLNNLVQNTAVMVALEVDGGSLNIFYNLAWTTAADDVVFIPSFTTTHDFTVYLQSATGEAVDKGVPYEYTIEVL